MARALACWQLLADMSVIEERLAEQELATLAVSCETLVLRQECLEIASSPTPTTPPAEGSQLAAEQYTAELQAERELRHTERLRLRHKLELSRMRSQQERRVFELEQRQQQVHLRFLFFTCRVVPFVHLLLV